MSRLTVAWDNLLSSDYFMSSRFGVTVTIEEKEKITVTMEATKILKTG